MEKFRWHVEELKGLVALKEIDRLFNDQNNKDINDDKSNSNNNNSDATNTNNKDKNVDDQFSFEEIKDSPKEPTLVGNPFVVFCF